MILALGSFKRNTVWYLLVIFAWLPCIAYTVGLPSLVSFGIYGTIALLALNYAVQIARKCQMRRGSFVYIVLSVFFVIFIFLKKNYMADDGIRDSMYLLLIFMTFSLVYQTELTKERFHVLYNVPFLLSMVMLVLAALPTSYDLNSYANALYLGFQNPNILSFVLLVMMVFNLLGYLDERKRKYLLGAGICLLLIWLTHSRGSLLSALVILAFYFWKRARYTIRVWLAVVTSLLPIVVVMLTLVFLNENSGFSIFGKDGTSGRSDIWLYVLSNYVTNKKFMLFGVGTYLNNYTNTIFGNTHNAYIQFICNFGLIISVIVMIGIMALGIASAYRVSDQYGFVAFAGIIGVMTNNSFETHIADGIIGMTFMWIVIYWMIISKGRINDNNSA